MTFNEKYEKLKIAVEKMYENGATKNDARCFLIGYVSSIDDDVYTGKELGKLFDLTFKKAPEAGTSKGKSK